MSLYDNDDDNDDDDNYDDIDDDSGHAHDADGGEDANDAIWDDDTNKMMQIIRITSSASMLQCPYMPGPTGLRLSSFRRTLSILMITHDQWSSNTDRQPRLYPCV